MLSKFFTKVLVAGCQVFHYGQNIETAILSGRKKKRGNKGNLLKGHHKHVQLQAMNLYNFLLHLFCKASIQVSVLHDFESR